MNYHARYPLARHFTLIPPVPLSLQTGMAAYDVEKENDTFSVTYEQPGLYTFWKSFDETFNYPGADTVYMYTSIFAPADLKKSVLHHWQWFNSETESWNTTDKISY